MLSTQLLIAITLFLFINPFAGFVWLFSVFITDPLLARIRQTLEHRNELDNYSCSLSENEELGVNHMFGNDFFSRYFGGAGFNRHLLHHLDPSISCTRFDEFEGFLLKHASNDYLDKRRTSYLSKARQIMNWWTFGELEFTMPSMQKRKVRSDLSCQRYWVSKFKRHLPISQVFRLWHHFSWKPSSW